MRRAFGWLFIWALAGCVSLSEAECRASDWQARGWQDAMSGMRPQVELYAHQCSAFGAAPDEKQYMAGWNAGYGEWNRRVSRSRP